MLTYDSTLSQWLAYIEQVHPSEIELGLTRCQKVYECLQCDFSQIKVITVAGTNGKGTTCAIIEQASIGSNKSVGVYSSPHMHQFNERIRINGVFASNTEIVKAFCKIDSARSELDVSLTYFEYATLAALLLFAQSKLDIVILEVGLGGRLDATNIIDSDIAVITSIGLDHQDWLGDTREKIAVEKAGVFRAAKPVVIGEINPPLTLIDAVNKLECSALWAGKDFDAESNVVLTSSNTSTGLPVSRCIAKTIHIKGETIAVDNPHIPLQNIATAVAVIKLLNLPVTNEQISYAVNNVKLQGRFQLIQRRPRVYVDVAHNEQAAEYIKTQLNELSFTRLIIVVGMLQDKNIQATLSCFESLSPVWYLASLSGTRGASAEQLQKSLSLSRTTQLFDDVTKAYRTALNNATENDLVLVIGSFLTAAAVIDLSTNTLEEVL